MLSLPASIHHVISPCKYTPCYLSLQVTTMLSLIASTHQVISHCKYKHVISPCKYKQVIVNLHFCQTILNLVTTKIHYLQVYQGTHHGDLGGLEYILDNHTNPVKQVTAHCLHLRSCNTCLEVLIVKQTFNLSTTLHC